VATQTDTAHNGAPPPGSAEKSLGDVVNEVSQKASLLVREEIELAKTELSEKVSSIVKGAAVAAAAGVFAVFALIYLLHALAWFFNDLLDAQAAWPGYLIVFGILIVLAGIAGLLGIRWIKRGSPPTPAMAIEEAKRTRAELMEHH
jgi:uncharacterized membrane protein YqjE